MSTSFEQNLQVLVRVHRDINKSVPGSEKSTTWHKFINLISTCERLSHFPFLRDGAPVLGLLSLCNKEQYKWHFSSSLNDTRQSQSQMNVMIAAGLYCSTAAAFANRLGGLGSRYSQPIRPFETLGIQLRIDVPAKMSDLRGDLMGPDGLVQF